LQCEPKKMIAVISISGIGRLPADIKFEDMPRELQDIVNWHEELLRRMAEREARMMEAFNESSYCSVDPETLAIKNPPLWRQHKFSYVGVMVCSGKKYRSHRSRIRRNLWSGQRKRQVISND